MYITDFICTYQMHDPEYQEMMYRIQFLQAFGMEEWNDEHVETKMKQLYDELQEKYDIKDIIQQAKKCKHLEMIITLTGHDNLTIFKLLFEYELFHATHKCLCELFTHGKISSNNKIELSHLLIQ